MHAKKILYAGLLGAVLPIVLYVGSTYSQCREDRPGEDPYFCSRERGDKRCNTDGECCSGKGCDSFGYCVRRR